MTEPHDTVVRESFARQVPVFEGPESPFATRPDGTVSWIEPLDEEVIALDVGCGAGHAAEAIAPRVREVVGVDLTPELLAVGAARVRAAGIDNVLLQEGNAHSLPFVDESFDLVFCRSSLHHFTKPQRAVDEMVRVCRTGGRIVLVDLVAPGREGRARFDHLHRLLDPSHVRTLTESELAGLLPGGLERLTYAHTETIRLPIDVAITEESEQYEVLASLRAEIDGGKPTGFEPALEDGMIVVSFVTTVVHSEC